ncbi:MAG: DUF4065 domain-containing protein [Pseudomonadales bacterium]|nr:DUF4065 domain-containing protein [Pseudomonadales bacterium]
MANVGDVAKFFLCLDDKKEGDGISNLKLQKLVYYAQGFHNAIHDEPLFDEAISAWFHGPVVESLYRTYKEYGREHIPVPPDFESSSLDQRESDLVEEVFEVFGQFSAWKLRNMTHEEPPWINHEESGDVIPLTEITEYFKARIN